MHSLSHCQPWLDENKTLILQVQQWPDLEPGAWSNSLACHICPDAPLMPAPAHSGPPQEGGGIQHLVHHGTWFCILDSCSAHSLQHNGEEENDGKWIQFLCSINNDEHEEIIAHNGTVSMQNMKLRPQVCGNSKCITAHGAPLIRLPLLKKDQV